MKKEEIISILERKTTIPGDGYTWEQINEAFDTVISILSSLNEPQTNEWLSEEQLWEMNNVPIWVVDTSFNRSEWCYWKDRLAYSCEAHPEYYDPDDYGHWLAYSRPPEGEEDNND